MNTLQRFVDAQKESFQVALSELKTGRKQSHWMWYIFPQLKGLGRSSTSVHYAINDLDEAKAFLRHPLLGSRLIEISKVLLSLPHSNPKQVFGTPDDLKLRSSMTLFAEADPEQQVFNDVLTKFFHGQPDPRTLELLRKNKNPGD